MIGELSDERSICQKYKLTINVTLPHPGIKKAALTHILSAINIRQLLQSKFAAYALYSWPLGEYI